MHRLQYHLAVVVLYSLLLTGCTRPATPAEREIPFTLTKQNNLVVRGVLNDTDPVDLMLHTAARDVTLTEAAVRKTTSLRFTDSVEVKAWGGGGSSRFAKGNQLRIGDLRRGDVTVRENKNSGEGTDGKFGLDFFEEPIVELDFDRSRIVAHQRLPAKASQFARLALEDRDGELFVEGTCLVDGKSYSTRFLLHTGYSGGLLLDDTFAANSGVDGKIPITDESTLKDSFGHSIKVKKGTLPTFVLGGASLADVPTGFFTGGQGAQKMSVLGGEVLKRFNVILDVPNKGLYLQPRA